MMEYNLGAVSNEEIVQEQNVEVFKLNEGVSDHPSIRTLKKAASLNSKRDEMLVYVSSETGTSYAGSRKYWGGSDLFMKTSLKDQSMNLDFNGSVNILTEDMFQGDGVGQGLLAAPLPNGKREIVTPERANNIVEKVKMEGGFEHSILLNPHELSQFIEPRVEFSDESTKTFSIMPSMYLNSRGHAVGILRKTRKFFGDSEFVYTVEVERDDNDNQMTIARSFIPLNDDLVDKPVMFNYVGVTMDGMFENHTCEVVMAFNPGIMCSIQNYESGHVLPMLDAYSVIPNENQNSLSNGATKVFKFLEGQNKVTANKGPMITFALPTFRALLASMDEFRAMEILYTNRTKKCYVRSIDPFNEVPYEVEAIISPISPYVYGKVLTY